MRKLMLLLTLSLGMLAALRSTQQRLARNLPAFSFDDFYDRPITG